MTRQAELISIGNELLSGRTLNAHAQTLGGALGAIGLRLVRDTTVPDIGVRSSCQRYARSAGPKATR